MRILLIAPNWIGDAVMSQPLATRLAQRWPAAVIDAVATPNVAAVMNAMPEVDTVLSMPLIRKTLQLRDRLRLANVLRERAYDRCYVLPNSFKSALAPWFARIPVRVGHRGEARFGLLNQMHDAGDSKSRLMVEHYAQLALEPGTAPPDKLPDPVLQSEVAVRDRVRKSLLAGVGERYIVLCPGAEFGPAKRWPTRHFAALARQVNARWPDMGMVCLGAPQDRGLATEIRVLSAQPVLNLAGETTLEEAIAVIALASGVVTNDSGLMHVAAALGRPLAAVFGSSDPRHTPPLSPHAQICWLQLECSPCFERTCPLQHTNCLNGIEPVMVVEALAKSIQINADSPSLR